MKSPLQLLAIATTTLISGFSFGQTRYVSTTGTDVANDCTLPGNPCSTIQTAHDAAVAGDSILVASGMYALTATVMISKDEIALAAWNPLLKPVIVSTASDVISVEAEDVSINGFVLKMGLTASTGYKGIVSAGNYDGLGVFNNEFISTKALTSGLAFGAYAVQLNSAFGDLRSVEIKGNTVSNEGAANDVFGRGFSLGSGSTDGPGGTVEDNDVLAYYPVQAVRNTGDLTIENNVLRGITMLNTPLGNTTITATDNTFDGQTATAAYDLYSVVDIRGIHTGDLVFTNNTVHNYVSVGVLQMASENVTIAGNTFTPLATATDFVSLMVNTKLMTNGVQGNTYSDEIAILGNTFNAGVATEGTAIVFADHYGVNTPAFGTVQIGGALTAEKNTFSTLLGNYINLDAQAGASSTVALWAPYAVTTMAPVSGDITALGIYNNYGFTSAADVETKNTDELDNAVLGRIILMAAGTNRYVALTGSNTFNSCTLPGNPCATIEYANSLAEEGNSIIIAPGTYALTSTLTLAENALTLTAADFTNKPVITSTASDVIVVDAEDVLISGLTLKMGLTATTGLKGITTTGNYDGLTITDNNFLSVKALTSGLSFGSYAVQLNSAFGDLRTVTIEDNAVSNETMSNDVFGRGFSLGSGSTDGPAGTVTGNDVTAYYTVQAVRNTGDLTIEGNTLAGIMMLNVPLNNAAYTVEDNFFDGITATPNYGLYSVVDIRGIETGSVTFTNNTVQDYTTIGLLSMASKNVVVTGNTFTPLATADTFVSVMATTKLMTNGVQGNTYSDEITLQGNTFNAGAASEGTAIVFADHYGANAVAFGDVTIGGPLAAEKNTFSAALGNYIALDSLTGSSAAVELWAPYAVTTMKAVTQDIEALILNNNYGLSNSNDIEAKNIDSLDNNDLGKVILAYTFLGLEENAEAIASVYPNPATDNLHIVMNEAGKTAAVQIIDVVGHIVYMGSITSEETISVTALNAGVYIVKMTVNNQQFSTRIVKN